MIHQRRRDSNAQTGGAAEAMSQTLDCGPRSSLRTVLDKLPALSRPAQLYDDLLGPLVQLFGGHQAGAFVLCGAFGTVPEEGILRGFPHPLALHIHSLCDQCPRVYQCRDRQGCWQAEPLPPHMGACSVGKDDAKCGCILRRVRGHETATLA